MLVAVAIVAAGYFAFAPAPPPRAPEPPSAGQPSAAATYVGSAACGQCHQDQLKAWTGSHHALAMQEARENTVLGDFNDTRFSWNGVDSAFFRRDGRYFVRTDGPDGVLADFEIAFTFGVTPLQQYLVALPGSRLQALGIAWDSRPKSAGGQRWFHLYPDDKIAAGDALHWTGIYQNWNLQCAECHSTNLQKGYDAATRTYRTTYSEINVACEACHGAGSRHVAWAREPRRAGGAQGDKGLVVRLHSRWDAAWRFPADGKPIAQRDAPADAALMNTCAPCHARRSTLAHRGDPGAPLEDTHRLAMPVPPQYFADGQQRDEVYTWGSFLQSRMFRQGVTCMDCHEPHALRLRAEGNAVCGRCHDPAAFDTPKHHFHQAGSKGAQCVECHMPARSYMVVDPRRDHGFRVPRPDISAMAGSPDACTTCHTGRAQDWAASTMDGWYGARWRDRTQDASTLHLGATQGARALPSLLELARDADRATIVRAGAAALAQPWMRPSFLPLARTLLRAPDPSLRIAALGLLEPFAPALRLEAAASLLGDPVRGVRTEAARLLADLPDAQMPPETLQARTRALAEYVESLKQDADWPVANVNLGNLHLRQGRLFDAWLAYRQALSLDPRFIGAYVNMADLHRHEGREAEAEKVLRRGLEQMPRAPELHHALGLLLVRTGDRAAALRELAEAASLGDGNPRYAYVYAVALQSAGRAAEALAVLEAAGQRHPNDLEILGALVSFSRERGATADALRYARRMAEIAPDDPAIGRLLRELEPAR